MPLNNCHQHANGNANNITLTIRRSSQCFYDSKCGTAKACSMAYTAVLFIFVTQVGEVHKEFLNSEVLLFTAKFHKKTL